MLARLGEVGSRPCQNNLGELADLVPMGGESNGDDSSLNMLFWFALIFCWLLLCPEMVYLVALRKAW